MAPRNKPMPKNKPKLDPVERILQERELEYQGAMGIANNDLRTKEAELLEIQKAYANSGVNVEGFDEFLANKHAEIKRAYRDVVSEQSYLFENDLRNYAIGSGGLLDITKTEAKQRKISQPIPGTQAHHPASVSSVESYLRNMPMAEQRRALDLLVEQGYTVGSQAKGFIPLSGPAHLGGGERWGRAFAHVGKEGVESDPGRFKGTALPKNATAEQAVAAMKPMLDEQIALNTAAYNHPVEQQMRAVAERLVGKPIKWMGGEGADIQSQNKAAKAMGINATTISKAYSRYPGLMESGAVPNVDVMTNVGTRAPLGMKPSQEVQQQASAVVRNPQVVLTPSQSLGQKPSAVSNIDPELVSQFSRQIGNRIDRRLGKSPFDETLDTTSQKYLENIGKYQQFIDLDEASKAALGLYGENVKQYYADLNRQLRTGSSANLTPQQIAVNEFLQGNLSRALDTLPSEQRDLYRAIKDPVREGLVGLKIGDIYTDKGFGSFSADEKAALRFIKKDAPSALITVQNAEGKNIGPVMEFDESEFLQKPGAQYRLESVDEIFSPKVGGTVPNYRFTQVTSQSLGQKAAAIANREPVKLPKPVVVSTKPVAKTKPVVKAKPAAKPKPARTTPAVSAAKPARTKPASASMQIRAMQNTAPDVLRIQPGMSLPSNSLIQGI
jgi:hypothetical protein